MCPLVPYRRLRNRMVGAVALVVLTIVPALGLAADVKPRETSLNKVPGDAEAYGAWLRMGETVEMIGNTQAWKAIWDDPQVQELRKKARESYDDDKGDWGKFKEFFADPQNKDLPAIAADIFSNEIFVYAGDGWADIVSLGQELVGVMRFGPVFQKLLAQNADATTRGRVRLILQALSENPKRIRLPDLVIGFKVSEPAKVAAQLKRLDPLLAKALQETPLKGRSERTKVDGDDFLVLNLDGSLVPWDELPLGMFEDKPGEFAPLLDHLKKMKFSVAVGVRQGYLLIALGESPNQLMKFGGKGPKLADRPEFKPLAKFADRPLTSLGYTSAKIRQSFATSAEDISGLGELAKTGLKQLELPEEQTTAIEKDIDALAKAISRGLKKPGADANFSFRTSRGWETYAYDYTEPEKGKPRPLSLLNHLGGDPLLAAVWRSGTTVEDYKTFVNWITLFGKHGEKIVAAKAPDGEEFVKKFRADALPLLKELNDIIEKLWLPALADGQEAFVIDAKWTSKRWHAAMPPSEFPLPMLEFGIILGVSDSAKLVQALDGYRSVINRAIAKASAQFAGMVPEFEIPKPKIKEQNGNTYAHYPIPPEVGLDWQFQPTGGLSKNVAALTLSPAHAQRLLEAIPLKIDSVVLKNSARPLDSMFHFNWGGMVDATAPWVQFLVRKYAQDENAEQVSEKVIHYLKLFRSYTSVTYREGNATITHSEAIFGDIGPDAKK